MKFLDRFANEWRWNVQDYVMWIRELEAGADGLPNLIIFDLHGEPLLPSLESFPLAKQRVKVLQTFLTTHYSKFQIPYIVNLFTYSSCGTLEMGTSHPAAHPPYSDMPNEIEKHVDDDFLPPEALPDNKRVYVQKPGNMGSDVVYNWLRFIHGRQDRYLAGESIFPFRWKAVKISLGKGKGHETIAPHYREAWMIDYASRYGTINDMSKSAETEHEPSPAVEHESPETLAPRRATRKVVDSDEDSDSDVEEDVIEALVDDGGNAQGDDSGSEDADEDFTSRLNAVSSDEDEELDGAGLDHMHSGALPPSLSIPSAHGRADTSPQPSHTTERNPLLDILADLEADDEAASEDSPPLLAPPCWVQGSSARKVTFLRAICTDEHFRTILDWYAKEQVSDICLYLSLP